MFQTLGIKTNWKAYSPQHSDLLRRTGVFLLENVVTVELGEVLTSAVELGGRHVLTSAGFFPIRSACSSQWETDLSSALPVPSKHLMLTFRFSILPRALQLVLQLLPSNTAVLRPTKCTYGSLTL